MATRPWGEKAYSQIALSDQMEILKKRLDVERQRRKMLQSSINNIVEALNAIMDFLDGQSKTKIKDEMLTRITFSKTKLEFVEIEED